MKKLKLIVGLGNPGKEYELTRHNVGFMVLDELAESLESKFSTSKKFQADLSQNGDLLLVKPNTFMNLSGRAVSSLATFYKILPDDILVIHDDLDLDFNTLRIRKGGTSAGHRGVESIISNIGEDFFRLRIGIKNEEVQEAEKFVLKAFKKKEKEDLKEIISEATVLAQKFVGEGQLEPITIKIK